MKNILLISDSFKDTLSSQEVNSILQEEIQKIHPDYSCRSFSFSDGGEGMLSALKENLRERLLIKKQKVTGPLMGKEVIAEYGILDDKSVVTESASIIGLSLLQENERNPNQTTTYGIGEMIKRQLDEGFRDFYISLGGSSTNDLGAGMSVALGAKYYKGQETYIPKGISLGECTSLDLSGFDKRVFSSSFTCLSDVTNPLLGKSGASFVFAKQKGGRDLASLDKAMSHMNKLLSKATGINCSERKGAGAAGGLGAGTFYFLHSKMESGAKTLLSLINLPSYFTPETVVITGEGKTDSSSLHGKVISEIASLCQRYSIPVLLVSGQIKAQAEELKRIGIKDTVSVEKESLPLDILKKVASLHLRAAIRQYLAKDGNLLE